MRRRAFLLFLGALVLAGCGSAEVVTPAAVKGDAAAGKQVFTANGCGSCHTFKPAGSTAKVGPDLDKLPDLAKKANQGSLEEFVRESIVNPSAYVESGFQDIMPKTYGQSLSGKQQADLVAFLTAQG
jgi:cytochrome c2